MKSWVKDLKVGDTLFFVSSLRNGGSRLLTVSKVGSKYAYVKFSEYQEIKIWREDGQLVDTDGEIYASQADYDECRRRSRVVAGIEVSMRHGGNFARLPTSAIDAIAAIIDGTFDVDALKAENERLKAAQEWQPIETAPEGVAVLACAYSDFTGSFFEPMTAIRGSYENEDVWHPSDVLLYKWLDGDRRFFPAVWMPLPQSPEAIAKARGES